jgi:hypothetical protein
MPVETGLTGAMSPPTDVLPAGTNRNYADMVNYLRWEEALGLKYQSAMPIATDTTKDKIEIDPDRLQHRMLPGP